MREEKKSMKRAYISSAVLLILVILSIINYFVLSNISNRIAYELEAAAELPHSDHLDKARSVFKEYEVYLCTVTYHSEIDEIRRGFGLADGYSKIDDSDDLLAQEQQLISDIIHLKENEKFTLQNIF